MDVAVSEPVYEARVKTPPVASAIPTAFTYAPSADGTDENLLILLHGLGDTHVPFARLAKQMRLPQTATLALRAPERVPFLHEEAYQWYTSFDALGELLAAPDPRAALGLLHGVLAHLRAACGWRAERVHVFGFGQGGSVAAEVARAVRLGSAVTVCGPLLSFPTSARSGTPVMVFDRVDGEAGARALDDGLAAFRRGFSNVVYERAAGAGMPRSEDEMRVLMQFWSGQLAVRPAEGMYPVHST